jgi:hypothetical protein
MLLLYLREKVLLHPSSGPFRKLSLLTEIHSEYKSDYNRVQGGASHRLRASGIRYQKKSPFAKGGKGGIFLAEFRNPESLLQAVPTIL